MNEEIVDVFDENFKYLGTSTKTEAYEKGLWIQTIHVWIIDPTDKGYVLFQKRGSHKKIYPNALDISTAGHYKAREKIEEGVREISEELGIHADFKDLVPLGIKIDIGKYEKNIIHEFCHAFFLKSTLKPEEYTFTDGEVEGLVRIAIDDGLALFGRKVNKVIAHGVERIPETEQYLPISRMISREQFVPRIDSYYFKVFIMAKLYLKEEEDLTI